MAGGDDPDAPRFPSSITCHGVCSSLPTTKSAQRANPGRTGSAKPRAHRWTKAVQRQSFTLWFLKFWGWNYVYSSKAMEKEKLELLLEARCQLDFLKNTEFIFSTFAEFAHCFCSEYFFIKSVIHKKYQRYFFSSFLNTHTHTHNPNKRTMNIGIKLHMVRLTCPARLQPPRAQT